MAALEKCFFQRVRLKSPHCSLIYSLQNGCYFGRHKNNINLVNTHQRSLTVRGVPVNENLLMLSSGSLHWAKIIQETVLQMDVLSLGSVVPFTEHGYSDSAS